MTAYTQFTSKERDAETGLDNFEARYYSGPQGRFMRPDDPLADQSAGDPQSWNLYAYTRNNPLRFIDPTGNACRVSSDGTPYDDENEGSSCAEVNEADGENAENVEPSVTVEAYMPGGMSPMGVEFYNQMSAQRQATNQLIGVAAGASVVLGATGGIASYALQGGSALTTLGLAATRIAPLLPALPSAIEKLQKLGISLEEANKIAASPTAQKLVDRLNSGNINVIQDIGGKLIRITLDPSEQRIISAGIVRANQVTNGIASGRFIVQK